MQKNSKNYKQFGKKQIIEANKIISYYRNIMYFFSVNYTKIVLKDSITSFGPKLKIIGICYYANLLKDEKKEHKYTTNRNLWKRIIYA